MRRGLLAFVLALAAGPLIHSAEVSLSLPDQFGASAELKVGHGLPLVVVTSDRRSCAEDLLAWHKALGTMPGEIRVVSLGSLSSIPFFVPKTSVTGKFAKTCPHLAILLDWKGSVASSLGAPKNSPAVLVFGPKGELLALVKGEASAAGAATVHEAVAKAVPGK